MNTKEIKQQLKKIKVRNQVQADVEVSNPTSLTMLGKGRQGAVFQIDENTCAKIYGDPEDCEREYYALSLGQHTNLFPRVYDKGENYVVMESVKGIDLREYLQSQPLTKELSLKLIEMLVTFQQIGFDRIDHHKRQIYLQPDGTLKVLDVGRTVWRDRTYPYPRKLLTSLGEEYKALFLSHVQEMNPELYAEWQHYMEMEETARQMSQVLLSKNLDNAKDIAVKLAEPLLTTKNQDTYTAKLEGLVRKVFKEEWIKVLVAQGRDPEKVKEKIDKYMQNGIYMNDKERREWDEMGKKKQRRPNYFDVFDTPSEQKGSTKKKQKSSHYFSLPPTSSKKKRSIKKKQKPSNYLDVFDSPSERKGLMKKKTQSRHIRVR